MERSSIWVVGGYRSSGITSNGEVKNRTRACFGDIVRRAQRGVYREKLVREGFAPLACTLESFSLLLSFDGTKESNLKKKKPQSFSLFRWLRRSRKQPRGS